MNEEKKKESERERERERMSTLIYLNIILHTIITLDIHYVYCIYVSIIVVSYIAMMMMMIMSMIITDDFGVGEGHTRGTRHAYYHTVRILSHSAREFDLCSG